MKENAAPILRAYIWALPICGRGVVHLVEEFEQCAIVYFFGIVDYLEGFRI